MQYCYNRSATLYVVMYHELSQELGAFLAFKLRDWYQHLAPKEKEELDVTIRWACKEALLCGVACGTAVTPVPPTFKKRAQEGARRLVDYIGKGDERVRADIQKHLENEAKKMGVPKHLVKSITPSKIANVLVNIIEPPDIVGDLIDKVIRPAEPGPADLMAGLIEAGISPDDALDLVGDMLDLADA
jgi:hypothetical protein